ncbi:hypothetical protein [Actinomadura rubrisoli]|uniref:Uncharacterized protein n=1 Tax=Actinomadura rubrisoli TaxID=2530368 RepID=A0A4R5C5V3_9ACTN|nr:hypothetical protein [Actinomadura rubrisoli]TDD93400.1 hypothetical protein E1298_09760 [Actinomadura rubrisoli]
MTEKMISDAPAQAPPPDEPPGKGGRPDTGAPAGTRAPGRRDELLVTGIPAATSGHAPTEMLETAPFADTFAETNTGAAAPVFVDPSGRRRRFGRRLGLAAGASLVLFLGALGVGVATGADVPLTTWDQPPGHRRASESPPNGREPRRAGPDEGTRRGEGRPGTSGGRDGSRGGGPVVSPSGAGDGSWTTPSAPPTPSAPGTTPAVTPTPTPRPGSSHTGPPAWGRKKKPR